MNLFGYASSHRKAILFTAAGLVVAGVAVTKLMPVSLFPDITFPRIVILADNGEQPAELMMIKVTKPLEEVASSIPGVEIVRSITGRGSTEISLGLSWKTDVREALQTLQNRIANNRNALPPSVSIDVEQMSVAVFPILGYSLTSDSISAVEMRDLALYRLRPAIMTIGGVARVEVVGGETQEFRVVASPEKLAAYRLDILQISDAIARTNLISSPGLIENNYRLYLSLVSATLHTVEDIENVVVATRSGMPLLVRDVATVEPAVAPSYIRTTAHGRPAVLISVVKQPTGSTVAIGQAVQEAVAQIKLPPGVEFENWYDQGGFIRRSILGTRDAIIIGILLSMVVMFLFLRNWRVSLVMVIVVPLTIAATLVCLKIVGETINIMTLGGIAAAVGLIIDDSIVVIENIFARIAESRNRPPATEKAFDAAASHSLRELMPAIIGSSASTIVINIPLIFLIGLTGAFFKSLALTMIFALALSFLFSVTVSPLLAGLILRKKDIERESAQERRDSWLSRHYAQALRFLLKYRILVIPVALGIAVGAYFIYGHIGSEFMPEMDEGTFVLDYASPPGTSLDETNDMLMHVESILMDIPEVESYSRRTGAQLGFFLTEPNTGDFLVKLKSKRSRSINDVIAEVRSKIEASEPSLQVDFGQLMMDVIGDLTNSPKPIEIKLFGDDVHVLQSEANKVAGLIQTVPGVVDVFDGIVISGPSFIMKVDPNRAALAGLTVDDIEGELESMIQGRVESSIPEGEKIVNIRVTFPEQYQRDIDLIKQMTIINSDGVLISLGDIASFEMTGGQAELDRESLRQVVAVSGRIEGRDMGRTIRDIKRRLSAQLRLPGNVSLEFGGVYQTQQESFRALLLVAIAAFLMVFIVLLFEFSEFTVPISVLTVSLLSIIGVVSALWITGVSFNISSFVGLIMIIGIVAENGVFVMHETKRIRAGGVDLDTALVTACRRRTRPIIMTTLAAVLALAPLALAIGTGSQMQQPLAIAVIGGFSVSSILLFFVLPALYRLQHKSK